MISYIENLRNLITTQVDNLIVGYMRPQNVDYDTRKQELLFDEKYYKDNDEWYFCPESPKNHTSSEDTPLNGLVQQKDANGKVMSIHTNNNPLYPANMVDLLNTPFDHIDRILLQDLSSEMFKDEQNYFRQMFSEINFVPDGNSEVSSIQMSGGYSPTTSRLEIDYGVVNSLFVRGRFFIDSFTYTPFIDYMRNDDDTIGIYSDDFLNKYNSGWFNVPANQVDVNRNLLSRQLYRLRNLEDDIMTAKLQFRSDVRNLTDKKVYIYNTCEHIAKLFAKLSNIRMSHVFYGFKSPHHQWEGILALDIWYQMLYRSIDSHYFDSDMFNIDFMGRNPMSVLEVDDGWITYNGNRYSINGTYSGLTIFKDEPGLDEKHVLLWDESVYNQFSSSSRNIRSKRSEHVTPRGVLDKIVSIIRMPEQLNSILDNDFSWFKQPGKVYSDSNKSEFTKYANLHLGRAYDVMTPREYNELCNYSDTNKDPWAIRDSSGRIVEYVKPLRSKHNDAQNKIFYESMLTKGYGALIDAFSVIRNEGILNIFNSQTNQVEEYVSTSKMNYSQGQCAIVIERIFSRLYKYLQFKSTTPETFIKHINIDQGYKYLDSESIASSDNPLSGLYFSEQQPYLGYVKKLISYANPIPGSAESHVLDSDEREILSKMIDILSFRRSSVLSDRWDLCPLCVQMTTQTQTQPELTTSRESSITPTSNRVLMIKFKIPKFIELERVSSVRYDSTIMQIQTSSDGRNISLTTQFDGTSDIKFDLSDIDLTFTFKYSGYTIQYVLCGFSADNSNNLDYGRNQIITGEDFAESPVIILNARWDNDALLVFDAGNEPTDGYMSPQIVKYGVDVKIKPCGFTYTGYKAPKFQYHTSSMWEFQTNSSDEVFVKGFNNWSYSNGVVTLNVQDEGIIHLNKSSIEPTNPIVRFRANWKFLYDTIGFNVRGQRYCDALVSKETNKLEHPEPPRLTDGWNFLGWNKLEGETLSGLQDNSYVVCIGSGEKVVCDGDGGYVVCIDDQRPLEYSTSVEALIGQAEVQNISVTFKFIDPETGEYDFVVQDMPENSILPQFHIHESFSRDGFEYRFRYWMLESGSITSSLTLMQDVVFTAVYDQLNRIEFSPEATKVIDILVDASEQREPITPTCRYASQNVNRGQFPQANRDGLSFCTFSGIPPRATHIVDSRNTPTKITQYGEEQDILSDYDTTLVNVSCPKVNSWLRKSIEKNDFDVATIIDASDIGVLLRALLKVNIDIAHREYYLKVELPNDTDWWYGYVEGKSDDIVCGNDDTTQIVCNRNSQEIVCTERTDKAWVSFEPTIEYKFSNMHALNQVADGKLVCTSSIHEQNPKITPVNRELIDDAGVHHSDVMYFYDYFKSIRKLLVTNPDGGRAVNHLSGLNDAQNYYDICPLCLYSNTMIQSPVNPNYMVRHRLQGSLTPQRNIQLQTFTSIVKKYRPIIMPMVRDIFNDTRNDKSKFQVDIDNDYGIFGWCTIPSKIMVDMQYNEDALVVPSSYDSKNHAYSDNFLMLDNDLHFVYHGTGTQSNIKNTWYYMYATRAWTYFMQPFFQVKPNIDLYSDMLDSYPPSIQPTSSNHINGILFETTNQGRNIDKSFGDIASTCQFLAKYHHNKNNLEILSKSFGGMFAYPDLVQLTQANNIDEDYSDKMNSMYGVKYTGDVDAIIFPYQDWIDDFDKTGSYVGSSEYEYNIGMRHAIDDFDDDSVWMYITMTSPLDDIGSVVELNDVMPYVFWWSNRGYAGDAPIPSEPEPLPEEPEPDELIRVTYHENPPSQSSIIPPVDNVARDSVIVILDHSCSMTDRFVQVGVSQDVENRNAKESIVRSIRTALGTSTKNLYVYSMATCNWLVGRNLSPWLYVAEPVQSTTTDFMNDTKWDLLNQHVNSSDGMYNNVWDTRSWIHALQSAIIDFTGKTELNEVGGNKVTNAKFVVLTNQSFAPADDSTCPHKTHYNYGNFNTSTPPYGAGQSNNTQEYFRDMNSKIQNIAHEKRMTITWAISQNQMFYRKGDPVNGTIKRYDDDSFKYFCHWICSTGIVEKIESEPWVDWSVLPSGI